VFQVQLEMKTSFVVGMEQDIVPWASTLYVNQHSLIVAL
jgi:hypothetical protein